MPLDGDHLEIVKYSSELDNNYNRVSKRIELLVRKIRSEKLQNS